MIVRKRISIEIEVLADVEVSGGAIVAILGAGRPMKASQWKRQLVRLGCIVGEKYGDAGAGLVEVVKPEFPRPRR